MGSAGNIGLDQACGPEGMRIHVIGDVHGCLDLLKAMHEKILTAVRRDGVKDWRIVHVGDYCDRGPDTKGVLDFLVEAQKRDRDHYVFLYGNHDIGFLEFLERPMADSLFARHGGYETACSYGVQLDFSSGQNLAEGHAKLVRALPAAHREFLDSLDLSAEFGDFFICHAGIRPGLPIEDQNPFDLIWIRGEFLDYPHLHPKVVIHGHTPGAGILPNRVNVDSGAYATGKLSAFVIDGSRHCLLEVQGNSVTGRWT